MSDTWGEHPGAAADRGAPPTEPRDGTPEPHADRSLESVLLDLAVELVDVDLRAVDAAIEDALRRVGQLRRVDRAYLFRYDWGAQTATNTHEWCAPGVPSQRSALTDLPVATWPDQAAAHRRGEVVSIPEVAALPADSQLRALLLPLGIASTTSAPLRDGRDCLGFVGFDTYRTLLHWSAEDQRLLAVLAALLVNVDRRRRQEAQRLVARDLARVNEGLQRYAGTVSHDLRGPLASIRGFVEVVRLHRVEGAQADELLDRALANLSRLEVFIDRLLDDAVAGPAVIDRDRVELREVVHEVLEALAGPIALRGANVEVGPLPVASGDHVQLVQLVQNLLSNALVHVPADRSPHVQVLGRVVDDQVELLLRDNGHGIPPAQRRQVMRAFERLPQARGVEGSGLGLAICRRIVVAHGGSIALGDAPGGGLEVSIMLPGAEQPHRSDPEA